MVKNDEVNRFKNKILNNLHKGIEDMINRKMVSSLEKIRSFYNDELQILRKEFESKDESIYKLLENISKKVRQSNPLPIPQL